MAISKNLRMVLFPYDSTRIGVGRWRWRQDFTLVECIDMLFVTSVGVLLLQAKLYIK
jgi:hypothetical protein